MPVITVSAQIPGLTEAFPANVAPLGFGLDPALAFLLAAIAILAALDFATLRWGADSRSGNEPERDW